MEDPFSSTSSATTMYVVINSKNVQKCLVEELIGRMIDDGTNERLSWSLLDDWIPKNGMEFDSRDEAWKFWVDYGGKMGFGVRKDY
ncbi:hypothetical protein RJ639_013339 [Escallonia herrerae]|uniref:Uncharacterized protein n=1 Tax=Escallonia herrerae TaxID=1293975 RepID=A0AA88VEV1_9ASTE|nr:hypothetical protein RJ639_013339 [Escallonia herrerae]